MKRFSAILIAIIFTIVFNSCSGCDYSEGERVGVVTKISYKGLIWKTWEGEMNLGGYRAASKGRGFVANLWEFSIEANNPNQEKLALILQKAMIEGNRVKVTYYDRGFVLGCWHSATSYWITSVTVIDELDDSN